MRTKEDIKKSLDIPKRHELRYYIRIVGELYGEPKDRLDEYVTEQLAANEHDLDGALKSFKEMLPDDKLDRLEKEDRAKRWLEGKK